MNTATTSPHVYPPRLAPKASAQIPFRPSRNNYGNVNLSLAISVHTFSEWVMEPLALSAHSLLGVKM